MEVFTESARMKKSVRCWVVSDHRFNLTVSCSAVVHVEAQRRHSNAQQLIHALLELRCGSHGVLYVEWSQIYRFTIDEQK